jgi:hypothetical protein
MTSVPHPRQWELRFFPPGYPPHALLGSTSITIVRWAAFAAEHSDECIYDVYIQPAIGFAGQSAWHDLETLDLELAFLSHTNVRPWRHTLAFAALR